MEKKSLEIHQTRRFAKRLAAMAKEGENERIVADRARHIIAYLHVYPCTRRLKVSAPATGGNSGDI